MSCNPPGRNHVLVPEVRGFSISTELLVAASPLSGGILGLAGLHRLLPLTQLLFTATKGCLEQKYPLQELGINEISTLSLERGVDSCIVLVKLS